MKRNRKVLALVTAASMTAGMMAVSGCTIGSTHQEGGNVQPSSTAKRVTMAPTTDAPEEPSEDTPVEETKPTTVRAHESNADSADLASLVEAHGAIAVAGIGEVNDLDFTVPAWSTIKVPISIAALRQDPSASGDVALAIQQSDNDAAARLWQSLASPAEDTAEVITDAGSSAQVQDQQVAPPYSSFGQSTWSVLQQANFAAGMRCVAGAQEVVGYMGNIANGANYGLGTIPGAIFKGGWGPNSAGVYGVRQFGVIPNDQGYVAIALAATSPDGSYESGQAVLTQMAQNVYEHINELPAQAC